MSNINFINKIPICCICGVIFLWTLGGQAETSPTDKKPVLKRVSIEEMGNALGSSGFLNLIVKEGHCELDGLRIKEQYIDANGTIVTHQENYPAWIEPWYARSIARHGIQRYSVHVNLRKSKDEKLWKKYLENVRLRQELAKKKKESEQQNNKDAVYIEPEKIERPPVWISVPEPNKVRVFVSVYDNAGNESDSVKVEQGFLFLPDGLEMYSDQDYDEPAEWMAKTQTLTSPPDTYNAALLYYQAFLSRPKPDNTTFGLINEVLRGLELDKKSGLLIRKYLKSCSYTINFAQAAAQIPQCNWGPLYPQPYSVSMNVMSQSRQLCFLLNVYARTLAADAKYRAAFNSCLTIRRLAAHMGDDTFLMFCTSQAVNTMTLTCILHILGSMPPDTDTLMWLKDQLTQVQGTPWRPAHALKNWRDKELQFWRSLPGGRAFRRELLLEEIKDESEKKELMDLTDEQLLVLSLRWKRMLPGRFNLSVPEQLLTRARQSYDKFLESALQIIEGDMPYKGKREELQKLTDQLEERANSGDPIALLEDPLRSVDTYYKFMVRNIACLNVARATMEAYLIKAKTGQLPDRLPDHLPKDPFTRRDFIYEITEDGFILGFDPENIDNLRVRQFEFKVKSKD